MQFLLVHWKDIYIEKGFIIIGSLDHVLQTMNYSLSAKLRKAGMVSADSVLGDVDLIQIPAKFSASRSWYM